MCNNRRMHLNRIAEKCQHDRKWCQHISGRKHGGKFPGIGTIGKHAIRLKRGRCSCHIKGIIQIRVKDVGDFIQVEIEDNGKGIAAKDLPSIFDRFYRTDVSRNSSKGGSGIGLSIVKKILEDHGGKVWATSRLGIGTIMYFVLRKYQEVPMK